MKVINVKNLVSKIYSYLLNGGKGFSPPVISPLWRNTDI